MVLGKLVGLAGASLDYLGQEKANEANLEQHARVMAAYREGLDRFRQRGGESMLTLVRARAEGRSQYDRAEKALSGSGALARRQIHRTARRGQGEIQARLTQRGLGGSSVAGQMVDQSNRLAAEAGGGYLAETQARLAGLLRERAGFEASTGGQIATLQNRLGSAELAAGGQMAGLEDGLVFGASPGLADASGALGGLLDDYLARRTGAQDQKAEGQAAQTATLAATSLLGGIFGG